MPVTLPWQTAVSRLRGDPRVPMRFASEYMRDHPEMALLDASFAGLAAYWCESAPWAVQVTRRYAEGGPSLDYAVPHLAVPALWAEAGTWAARLDVHARVAAYLDSHTPTMLAAFAAAYATGGRAAWGAAVRAAGGRAP